MILEKLILILINFYITMLIEHVNLFFENYIFEFINEYSIVLFAIIINFSFHVILIRNDFEKAI